MLPEATLSQFCRPLWDWVPGGETVMRRGPLVGLILVALSAPTHAAGVDVLEGKFAFNWHADPAREKCVKVTGPLMSDFRSAKYRCDLTLKTSVDNPAGNRTCTAVRGDKEYLIFDTKAACETERKGQAAAE